MDNVVSFPTRTAKKSVDPVLSFIEHDLHDWAQANNIDTSSTKYKYAAAGIMSCLQGMLIE